jgi:protein OS-9
MVISTPRLCNDAAFRPPKGPKAHPIACSPVIASESMRAYIAARESAAAEYEASQRVSANKGANKYLDDLRAVFGVETVDANADSMTGEYDDEMPDTEHNGEHRRTLKKNLPRVGDIEVGGHNIIPEGTVLEKGIVVGGTGNEKHITTIARSDGYTASEKELSKLNIHGGKELELIKDRVRRTADGADWQIDVVETARGKELRGIIGDSEEKKAQKAKAAKKSKLKENKAEEEEAYDDEADDEYENAEGSEERYKEEL